MGAAQAADITVDPAGQLLARAAATGQSVWQIAQADSAKGSSPKPRSSSHTTHTCQDLVVAAYDANTFDPLYRELAYYIATDLPTPVSYTHLDVYKRQYRH